MGKPKDQVVNDEKSKKKGTYMYLPNMKEFFYLGFGLVLLLLIFDPPPTRFDRVLVCICLISGSILIGHIIRTIKMKQIAYRRQSEES